MACHTIKLLPFLLVGLFSSCIREVNVPIRNTNSMLVVEGAITTGSPPYNVKLTYSGQFSNTLLVPKELYISDAKVLVLDDMGDSTNCVWTGNGNYQTSDSGFIGVIGRSYFIKIHLANGKTFISRPEKILPVPPIDSISVSYDSSYLPGVRPTQLIISVNTKDPKGMQNFYRWTASTYIPRKSWGNPCVALPPSPPCVTPFICKCYALCAQLTFSNDINILSDQFIDGNEISNRPVFYSPIYWFGRHFTEVNQFSLTKSAYIFWEQYLAQTNRTGSILDPLPAALLGNVYNESDRNEIALGYFFASDITTKRAIIFPKFVQEYLLEAIAAEFIEMGDCHDTYPNSTPDATDPFGWGNVPEIIVE